MKKIILITLLMTSMLLIAAPMTALAQTNYGSAYSDISGKWFADAASQYGYTEIFSDGSGKFNPNKKITRIEFVRLLHKALGISINYFAAPDVKDSFDDMKNTDVGAGELIDLATTGIVERGGNFYPLEPLERDQMIHWIIKALDYETGGDYAMIKIMPPPFDDDAKITPAYKNDVIKAVILKLAFGRGNNMLFPKDGASRAEAVTIVSRLVTLLESLKGGVDVTASAGVVKGGALVMSLTIHNSTDKTVTINHTSGQKYDFRLFDAKENTLYTWSANKRFMAALGTTELKAGESVVYSDTLDSTAYEAVSSAVTMRAYIIGTSDDLTIDEAGYWTSILK